MNLILKSKKSIIAAGILAAVLILGVGIHYYLNAPQNVISLDVNPSIEIQTNRLGYVVSIDTVNDDAATVMAGYQLKNKDLETVIGDIVDRLILNGYLVTEDTNEILVSADNTDSSQNILGKVTSVINTYLKNKQLNVTVLKQTLDADSEDAETAHTNKVSVGKMAMINKIMDTNKDVTVEDLSDDSVKELMQYFDNADISAEELAQNYAIVPSVTPAAAEDAQEQGDTEIGDDRDSASAASTNPDIDDNEDNDTAKINESDEDSKVTINVDTASTAKSSSESKKHKSNSSLAAKASDIENENEDSQDEDSITKDDTDSYDKEDQDNENDSQIKEDNDYDNDEDADYEDASEYDAEKENDGYSYDDSEDKEDSSDKEDSYEKNNTEDGHYGSHYENDDQGEDD